MTTVNDDGVALKSGMRLRYIQQGPSSGPAVILLHGYSDSSFSFSRVLPLLPTTLRVVVPDQRGHGQSDRSTSGYAMDALAGDVLELMDVLDIPTATVVGHSMGSFVARWVAALAPERVTSLLLVGAGLSATNPAVLEVEREANALTDPVSEEFVRAFQFSTISMPVPSEFMESAIRESLKLDASTWQAVIAGLVAYTPAEAGIRSRVLILGGDQDGVFPVEEQQALGRAISGARVITLPGIGHAPHWEHPTRFAIELLRFVG
jgi:non-heme chloroperoxidase